MPTAEIILIASVIFVVRVINNAISTIRVVVIARHEKMLAAVLGFIEALMFTVVMAAVIADLSNLLNLFAYCTGYAVGSYIGMALESKLITSYATVNVITHERGHVLALLLRDAGFGVTESSGEGRDGSVTILRAVAARSDVTRLVNIIRTENPNAFVAIEEARPVQRGWLRRSSVRPV